MTSSLTAKKVRSRLLAAFIGGGLALMVLAAIVMFRGSPRAPKLTAARFESSLELWRENKPANYEITVKVTGRQPGEYQVQVQDGVVTSASLDGRPLRNRRTLGTWAVPGMFETVRIDLATNEKKGYLLLRAEFDPQLGFPRRYERIEMKTGAHDALQWVVVSFEPKTSR